MSKVVEETPRRGSAAAKNVREINGASVRAAVAAGIGYLVGPTAIIGPTLGLFMLPTATQFGLKRSGISLMMCGVAAVVAITSPFAGRLIDRFGVRRVVLPAVLLFGLAEASLGLAGASFTLYAALYTTVGVLAGTQNPIAYTKLVSLWFNRHRGVVLSLTGAIGGGGGAVVVPQIADALIRRGGWQLGYLGLGVFIMVLGVPCLWLLLREPRAALLPPRADVSSLLPGLNRSQALHTATFWMVLAVIALTAGSVFSIAVHFPALLATRYPGSHLPAQFLSLFAVGSAVGQFCTGACLDRIDSPKVGVPFLAIASLGALALLRDGGTGAALSGGLLTGCGLGAELGLGGYYVSRFFGLRAYGQIYGSIYGTMVASTAFGPFLMGYSYDERGSYDVALSIVCAALLGATLVVFLLPPYRFKPPADAATTGTRHLPAAAEHADHHP